MSLTAWPVPNSPSKVLPKEGEPGSFWEDRGDRHHCGLDIYAPIGAEVVSISGGRIIDTGVFTSPRGNPYWNVTIYVLVGSANGLLIRYAELGSADLVAGDEVKEGQRIGVVGQVLSRDRISGDAPGYIRRLVKAGNGSMLHLEVFNGPKVPAPGSGDYSGGNWFGPTRPSNLCDPSDHLGSGH